MKKKKALLEEKLIETYKLKRILLMMIVYIKKIIKNIRKEFKTQRYANIRRFI